MMMMMEVMTVVAILRQCIFGRQCSCSLGCKILATLLQSNQARMKAEAIRPGFEFHCSGCSMLLSRQHTVVMTAATLGLLSAAVPDTAQHGNTHVQAGSA